MRVGASATRGSAADRRPLRDPIFGIMVGHVTAEDLRRVVERLSDGLMLFDREGSLLYLNAEAERIVGRPGSELVGKPLRETMPEVVYMVCESSRARLLAGEEVLLVRGFFGQRRWYEVLG